jgi:ribose transport system ATP-binding protein
MSRFRAWIPLVLLATLIVALGSYTSARQDAFATDYNLRNLLLTAMPLALVALGQTSVLLVGGFDVSVAALITFGVVTASYTMQPGDSGLALLAGAFVLISAGLATGVFNATLIRVLGLPSIIATLGTLSILQGASLLLRDHPEGPINAGVVERLTTSLGFVPVAFIAVAVLAVAGDLWLYRTRSGLAMRAVGLDETSARRLGMGTGRTVFLAFVACSLMASLAAFYSAAQVQIGSPIIGSYALDSIAAAVLGGASLAGGRGSFVGALLGALFLTLIGNVLPLFQQPTEYAQMTVGALILLALVLYQGPDLLARLRTSWQAGTRLLSRKGEAPAG